MSVFSSLIYRRDQDWTKGRSAPVIMTRPKTGFYLAQVENLMAKGGVGQDRIVHNMEISADDDLIFLGLQPLEEHLTVIGGRTIHELGK